MTNNVQKARNQNARNQKFWPSGFLISGLLSAAAAAGGAERDRTVDLLLAKQALSQLSYSPFARCQEPGVRNQDNILIPRS